MDTIAIIKTFSALAYPTGLIVLLILWIFLRKALGYTAWFSQLMLVSVIVASSNPMFAKWLANGLEAQHPQQKISLIAEHDAIVVLGGGLRIPVPPARAAQLTTGSDRYWHATQLYKAGRAKTIVITGGNVYEQKGQDNQRLESEAHYAAKIMQQWGVSESDILIEGDSRTTEQNRINTAALLEEQGVQTVILVTSALHMPRSLQQFAELPVSITPAAADVLVRDSSHPPIFNWLPSVDALKLTTQALHEYYGMLALRIERLIKQFTS
ncbi:MAG: YdcF family protein [Acidiferrobacterales bacterium]|nr:YdcF family protein [Acidiferrobacterales bacterium]